MRTTLFVAGFGGRTRARDLAYEFERYGRLVRCDIPAPKSFAAKVYAFVEYEDPNDAEDAFNEMHGRRIDGYTISVQWARNAPSASWRLGGPSQPAPPPPPLPLPSSRIYSNSNRYHSPPYHYHHQRRRSMSPPRGRSPPPPHYLRRYSNSRSRSPIPSLHNSNRSPIVDSKKPASPTSPTSTAHRRNYHSPPLI